jgi:hypothetical protein
MSLIRTVVLCPLYSVLILSFHCITLIFPEILSCQSQQHKSNLSSGPIVNEFRFGALFGSNANFYEARFRQLNGFTSCCPEYNNGSGFSPSIGLFIELPINTETSLDIRANLTSISGRFVTIEEQSITLQNKVVRARIEHSISTALNGVGMEALAHTRLFSATDLYGGFRIDWSITGTALQQEKLVFPEVGTFENERRIRNEQEGSIQQIRNASASLIGGLRTRIALNKDRTLLLLPDLSISYGLTNITRTEDWRVHALRFGLGLGFQPKVEELRGVNSTVLPTIATSLFAIPFDGVNELPNKLTQLTDFESYELHSLLPMIFFEHGSIAIPSRYNTSPDSSYLKPLPTATSTHNLIEIENTYGSTQLQTYYHVLNIIGRRLKQHQLIPITLVGSASTKEWLDDSAKAYSLAYSRAENVARYLGSFFGIERRRLFLKVDTTKQVWSVTPYHRSDATESELYDINNAQAEQRRVELVTDDIILKPLLRRDTTTVVIPPYIRFRPQSSGTDFAEKWEIAIMQGSAVIKLLSGQGTPPRRVDYNISESIKYLTSDDSLRARLVAYGKRETASSVTLTLPTKHLSLSDKALLPSDTTYWLVPLFYFDKEPNFKDDIATAEWKLNARNLQSAQTIIPDVVRNSYSMYVTPKPELSTTINSTTKKFPKLNLSEIPTNRLNEWVQLSPPYSTIFPENRFYNSSVWLAITSW